MFNKQLIRKINSGRCLALVGSGPSCEVGYPSWDDLAKQAVQRLTDLGRVSDPKAYAKYLHTQQYPELFRQLERDLANDRDALTKLLKPLLTPVVRRPGRLYQLLGRWPFACYLTTNYDDEVIASLTTSPQPFRVIGNRLDDFYLWRDGVSNLVQKLHSDLDHPDDIILTSADYRRLHIESSGQYFRQWMSRIFTMFDVLIIGHSLTDPDIDVILKLAKENASPAHPIYFIGAGYTIADEKELLEKYNVVLIQYDNADGTHSALVQLLRTADRFIAPRTPNGPARSSAPPPSEEVNAAMALSLYRRLRAIQPTDYLGPLILSGLAEEPTPEVPLASLATLPALRELATDWVNTDQAISAAIAELRTVGLVATTDSHIKITTDGSDKVREVRAIRDAEKVQAYEDFAAAIKGVFKGLTERQLRECGALAEQTIVGTFRNRGSIVANKVYSGQQADASQLSDVFAEASGHAATLQPAELRIAFMEGIYHFIVEPTDAQTAYLASLSQGYFLYHLLGRDPRCSAIRTEIFRKTAWVFDSSVILPLVAVGCYNHAYAVDLFETLRAQDALLCITSGLLEEAWRHFLWAVRFAEQHHTDSLEFLRAALIGGSYKQNLFLDGYIRSSADGTVGTFNDYLRTILPSGHIDRDTFDENLTRHGVRLIHMAQLPGFSQDDWGELEEIKAEIQTHRETRGTFRSALQVEAEAEVFVLIRKLREGKYSMEDLADPDRFYFVSQSGVMDRVFDDGVVTTWSPEALYRYLAALPKAELKPDLLQQCMLHEYYYAGVSFVDSQRYRRFFGPSIDAAKASYEIEKAQYLADIEDTFTRTATTAFEQTPDLEKPFFTAQMGWRHARASKRREDAAMRRAMEAEEKVRKLEAERGRAWKTRGTRSQEQEDATERNLQDLKHLRKRRRQAKKKNKKKGK